MPRRSGDVGALGVWQTYSPIVLSISVILRPSKTSAIAIGDTK